MTAVVKARPSHRSQAAHPCLRRGRQCNPFGTLDHEYRQGVRSAYRRDGWLRALAEAAKRLRPPRNSSNSSTYGARLWCRGGRWCGGGRFYGDRRFCGRGLRRRWPQSLGSIRHGSETEVSRGHRTDSGKSAGQDSNSCRAVCSGARDLNDPPDRGNRNGDITARNHPQTGPGPRSLNNVV
jgi:hypothetical protein